MMSPLNKFWFAKSMSSLCQAKSRVWAHLDVDLLRLCLEVVAAFVKVASDGVHY